MAGRTFAPISEDELWTKIWEASGEDEHDFDVHQLKDHLGADIKVEFDSENCSFSKGSFGPEGLMGGVTLSNNLTFWGICAGGDWESPVYFIVYWDGKKLRGYVPTAGNPWNTDTHQAFGNDDEADLKNARKRWPKIFVDEEPFDVGDVDFEPIAIRQDILERFTPAKNKLPAAPKIKTLQERIEALTFYGGGDEAGELFQEACSFCYHLFGLGQVEQAKIVCMWAEDMAACSKEDSGNTGGDDLKGAWG